MMFAKLFRSKTADSLQDLDDTRAAIATTKARLTALVSLPVPLEEADARIDRFFAERAAEYRPEVGMFLWPAPPPLPVDNVVGYKQEHAMWAAFLGPQLAADWKARLRTRLGTAETITAAERTRQLEEHRLALRALEEREERIICAAELAGFDVDRRADADPAVVLGTPLDDDDAAA